MHYTLLAPYINVSNFCKKKLKNCFFSTLPFLCYGLKYLCIVCLKFLSLTVRQNNCLWIESEVLSYHKFYLQDTGSILLQNKTNSPFDFSLLSTCCQTSWTLECKRQDVPVNRWFLSSRQQQVRSAPEGRGFSTWTYLQKTEELTCNFNSLVSPVRNVYGSQVL